MNKNQQIVMRIGISIVVGMIVYPPWIANHFVFPPSDTNEKFVPVGYHLILSPPKLDAPWGEPTSDFHYIDIPRLSLQIAIVGLITAGLMATFRTKPPEG